MKTSLGSTERAAMNEVKYPTKEEWLIENNELLAKCNERIAAYRRHGSEVPKGLARTVAEIRDTIEQRSKWIEKDFDVWRNAPIEGEVGYEEYKRDYPHLQPVWEKLTPAIAIDYTAMLRQAGMTAETYLIDGVAAIDESLGKGFAREHPKLIAAFMQAAGAVYAGKIIARDIGAGFDGIAEAFRAADLNRNLGAIAEKVRGDSPPQAESFDGLTGALRELVLTTQNIAAMVDIVGKQMPTRYE
jgi:hypothetical protein